MNFVRRFHQILDEMAKLFSLSRGVSSPARASNVLCRVGGRHASSAPWSAMTGRHVPFIGIVAASWLLCTSRPRRATFYFERERRVRNPGRLTRCALHAFCHAHIAGVSATYVLSPSYQSNCASVCSNAGGSCTNADLLTNIIDSQAEIQSVASQ